MVSNPPPKPNRGIEGREPMVIFKPSRIAIIAPRAEPLETPRI